MAEIVGEAIASPAAAANKVVEAVAEEAAQPKPLAQQLSAVEPTIGGPQPAGSAGAYTQARCAFPARPARRHCYFAAAPWAGRQAARKP